MLLFTTLQYPSCRSWWVFFRSERVQLWEVFTKSFGACITNERTPKLVYAAAEQAFWPRCTRGYGRCENRSQGSRKSYSKFRGRFDTRLPIGCSFFSLTQAKNFCRPPRGYPTSNGASAHELHECRNSRFARRKRR